MSWLRGEVMQRVWRIALRLDVGKILICCRTLADCGCPDLLSDLLLICCSVSDRVAGHFQLTVKLPPEFAMTDVRSLMADFHFFDGLATRRMSDSVMCLFRVSTDADGDVSSAEIWLRQSDTAVDEHQHSLEVYDFLDQVGFDVGVGRTDCGAVGLAPFASVNGGGTWSNGSLFSDGFEGSWPEMRSPGDP